MPLFSNIFHEDNGTAQLNNLDPAAWLKNMLTKLPDWPNSRIDELLPLTPEFIESL